MSLELLQEMRERYGTPAEAVDVEPEKAFILEAPGRTVITAPVREVAMGNDAFTYITGRFVEADNPNANGAYWSSADLELGAATVAGGPLNWLHDERAIIGSLLDGRFVGGRQAAADEEGVGNHIASTAAVWRFLHPDKAYTIEAAAADGRAFYSMECVSRSVMCLDTPGRPGCGQEVSYADYDQGRTCAHMRERSSIRRFVDPLFLGGAVIVPPIKPGWGKANLDIVRQATAAAEKAGFDPEGLDSGQAVDLAAAILQWASRDEAKSIPTVAVTVPAWQFTTNTDANTTAITVTDTPVTTVTT